MIEFCEAKKRRCRFGNSSISSVFFALFLTVRAVESKTLILIIIAVLFWLLIILIFISQTKIAYELAKKFYPKDKRYQIIPYDFSGIILDHESKKIYFGERGFLSTPLSIKYDQISQSVYTSYKEDCIEIKIGRKAKRYLILNYYKDNAQKVLRRFFVDKREYSIIIEEGSIT